MLYPELQNTQAQRLWTEQFIGLDRRPRAYDGAFSSMGNMSGDPFPLLSSRKKRGLVAALEEPKALAALGELAWIDGNALYYGGQKTALDDLSDEGPKRIVTMGAYLLVFPDRVYYNTAKPEDYGAIDRLWESSGDVAFTLCDMDGIDYPRGKFTVSDEPPENPEYGDYWINTSEETHTLYQYNEMYEDWYGVSSVYIKIAATGIGAGLNVQDGVELSGIAYDGEDESLKKQFDFLNEAMTVMAVDDDYILVIGIIDQNWTQTSGTVRADRKMPEMEYIIECNNRLWGCHYGENPDGEFYNLIYASALGDFKNWQKFMGTSQDSYFVYVGTPGPFTGAAVHRGNPYFFKRDCVHKIYGAMPSNFQTQVTIGDGVLPGCDKTLVPYNGVMYYLSAVGVMAFESLPQKISAQLGDVRLTAGAAGQCGGLYYLSAQDQDGQWSLYTYDTERGLWHRQDGAHAMAFAALNGEMYMLESNGLLWAMNGQAGEIEESAVEWFAETAPMGLDMPSHKYIGRLFIRAMLKEHGECRVYIQYDNDGIWRSKGVIRGTGKTEPYLLAIQPRRCDQMKLRLEGNGDFMLYGIGRNLMNGSDRTWRR